MDKYKIEFIYDKNKNISDIFIKVLNKELKIFFNYIN